ncbi:MAG TPA: methyltransferase domain-containing protein [Acidimicrobiales bacterium]|nr:methyltransferase domain-containing protein [Acidimicrobiales bacterium]
MVTSPNRRESTRDVPSAFDDLASRYDEWYDSPLGARIFALECACLAPLLASTAHPRLEIGVGSGRFAQALELDVGVDVAAAPLELAAARSVHVVRADARQLPFVSGSFGAVAAVMTLCFVDDPVALVAEARRVLFPGATLVLGTIRADSAWGEAYQSMGRAGHAFYRDAHFFTLAETIELVTGQGFEVVASHSTLVGGPEAELDVERVHRGAARGASFVALGAVCPQRPRTSPRPHR